MGEKNDLPRRQFLKDSGIAAAGFTLGGMAGVQGCKVRAGAGVPLEPAVTDPVTERPKQNAESLLEHGFWDYTTPLAGGMEAFQRDDYSLLLDDMAEAGMNSLVICPKWMTTGYRSRLPFMDQVQGNPVIDSDNALLRYAIEQAGKRNIKVWLLAVVNHFDADKFGFTALDLYQTIMGFKFPFRMGVYDSDTPVLPERAAQVCEELVELFPGVGGLIVELEADNLEMPHRIPLYNAWAKENGRPSFDKLGHPLNPRSPFIPDWRDYTTHRRLEIMKVVEKAVRAKGFRGEFLMICGLGENDCEMAEEINLKMFHKQLAHWGALHYDYSAAIHRYSMKDFGILLPKALGIKAYYLPRGVMTWNMEGLRGTKLEQHWQTDVEDFQLFRPHGLWWFGCGTVNDGIHVSLSMLRSIGYRDGAEARRALLKKVSVL